MKWQITPVQHRQFKRELWAAYKLLRKCKGELAAYRTLNHIIQKMYAILEVEIYEKESRETSAQ